MFDSETAELTHVRKLQYGHPVVNYTVAVFNRLPNLKINWLKVQSGGTLKA